MGDIHQTMLQFQLRDGSWLQVVPITPNTFRVRLSRNEHFPESPLMRCGIFNAIEQGCTFKTEQNETSISIQTEHSQLVIDTSNGLLDLSYESSRDVSEHVHFMPHCRDTANMSISLDNDEKLYGLGDGCRGHLQIRGHRADMWVGHGSAYMPIPYVMSSRGWAMLLASTFDHRFDLGCSDPDLLRINIPECDHLDFYLFTGKSYCELLNRYTDIAGKPTVMPNWAYGLSIVISIQQIEARELLNEALRFRQANIPCDRIVLGRGWSNEPDDGESPLTWDPVRFPANSFDSSKLPTFIQLLQKHGFKLGVVVSGRFDSALHTDILNPHTDADLSSYNLQTLLSNGVSCVHISREYQWREHPETIRRSSLDDKWMHNLLPVLSSKRTYGEMARHTNRRPLVVNSVAGYTGVQQFVSTSSGYSPQECVTGLTTVLSFGLSGHSNVTMNMDLSTREGIHASFLQPWSQVGNWSEFWNPHWLEDSLKALFRLYAKLHYRLLPYIYSAAHHASRTGLPIVRAMPLMYPDDPQCQELASQYMLGDYLLVAGFTTTVYLPAGEWIDYWTKQRISGGQTIEYDIPNNAGGPLFVRAGAIIPQWTDVDYIGQSNAERIELHIYPHGQSHFILYEDDGDTLEYKEGRIAVTRIEVLSNIRQTTVRIFRRNGTYDGMPARRYYNLILHMSNKPATIRLNHKSCPEQKHRVRSVQHQNSWYYEREAGVAKLYVEEVAQWAESDCVLIECIHSTSENKAAPTVLVENQTMNAAHQQQPGTPYMPPELAVYHAMQAGHTDQLEHALQIWWLERRKRDTRAVLWRMDILKAATFAIKYVELRGSQQERYIPPDSEWLFNLKQVSSAEQGYAYLQRLMVHCTQYVPKRPPSVKNPVLHELIDLIERHIAEKLRLYDLADRIGVHHSYLSRLVYTELGESFTEFVMRQRMLRAKALLEFGLSIRDTAAQTGFPEVHYFIQMFHKYWAIQPHLLTNDP